MAIREFSPELPRAKIAFFNGLPSDSLEQFTGRRFECVSCTEEELRNPDFIALLDAVIFFQNPEKRNALGPMLRATIPMLLNNGVSIYVRIASDPDKTRAARGLVINTLLDIGAPLANISREEWTRIPKALREREGGNLAPYVYISDSAEPWSQFANVVCDHPAGNSPNNLLLSKDVVRNLRKLGEAGHEERLLLLRRAFSDCRVLHLKPMMDGLSGANVFKAYASLRDGLVGDWPYLHFVKLGPRKKIADEYDKYVGRALDYVPFHLGPRLRLERCNLGASQGILVGDFVEGAEPIRDCAPGGRAGHAIANLFDKTLGAWRKQARRDSSPTLAQYLEGKWLDENGQEIKLPPARATIVGELGGNPLVAPSREIFGRHSHGEVLCGPAHGDLHATNVLVRGGDAIIIDFEKTEDHFPMLYDPASLEGGLLVDGFGCDARCKRSPRALLESIGPLYRLEVLNGFVVPCHAADQSSWFYDSVAQIRAASRHAERATGQYALVLALCLIRKGCNPQPFKTAHENLRAIAFILGQRILTQIGQQSQRQVGQATEQPKGQT